MASKLSKPPVMRTVFCTHYDSPDTIDQILCFRKEVLFDTLGWNVNIENGRERDEFDTNDAVYCAIYSDCELIATFRAIRTDNKYLAKEKFPQLATERPYPESRLVWELSRLAVRSDSRPFEALMFAYSAAFYFAQQRGARSLVAFADVAKERLVRRIGITTSLLGEPQEIGEDNMGRPIVCVAGELPLKLQSGARFEKLMSYVSKTEIEDAAAIFRRQSISA